MIRLRTLPILLFLALSACGSDSSSSSSTITKQDLAPGDTHCSAGGVALTVDGSPSYICNGVAGGGGASVSPLTVGDTHCPTGGTAVTASGVTNYVCNGAKGNTGLTGGGLYVSRSDVYCDTVTMPNNATVTELFATCRSANDLPLSGYCDFSQTTASKTGIQPAEAEPQHWSPYDSVTKATWVCSWMNGSGTLVNLPGAYAGICCVINAG